MTFDIESFRQFQGDGKVKAGFSVKTAGGMYYDMKLVEYGNGYFVASNQKRSYDKPDGSKAYVSAFGSLRDTPAAKFFDDVATQAAGMLKVENTMNSTSGGITEPPFNPDDDIPF